MYIYIYIYIYICLLYTHVQLSNEKCLIASRASPTFYDVGPENIGHFLFINLYF